tara:strand:+ start:4341 stop:5804 length:1464 start_codon:yes stop_codon:yes gene_type:complete
MSYSDVPISLSSAQVRSLKNGGAITISPAMVEKEGKHILHLGEGKIKKLLGNLKKRKGMRISLSEKEGEGFSLKHLGRSISKGAKSVGKVASSAGKDVGKALTSKEGKIAVKSLIDVGLPIAFGAAGGLVGGPGGAMAGAALGGLAAKEAEPHYKDVGYGFFKNGKPRKHPAKGMKRQGGKDREDEKMAMEIHELQGGSIKSLQRKARKGLQKVVGKKAGKAIEKGADKTYKSKAVQEIGKQIVKQGATAAGTAIGAYLGGPEGAIMGEQIGEKLGNAGAKQIGKKKSMKSLGNDLLKEGKDLAFSKIDALIDEKLTGREKEIAKAAIRGQKKAVAYGAVGYAKDLAEDSMKSGEGFMTNSKRMITPAPDGIMTLSPYARVNSAQMTPYIHASPQLATPVARKAVPRSVGGSYGGSIYPAGHSVHRIGNGINPAGGYTSGRGINPAGGSSYGGAIYNPHNDPTLSARNQRIGRVMRRHMMGGSFNPA